MAPTTLVETLCAFFACDGKRLEELLRNPIWRHRAGMFLQGRKLKTLHHKDPILLEFGQLTQNGADKLYAYEKFLGVTVQQHFYCRHRIKLIYPRMACAEVVNANGIGHSSYYPLEVLTVE